MRPPTDEEYLLQRRRRYVVIVVLAAVAVAALWVTPAGWLWLTVGAVTLWALHGLWRLRPGRCEVCGRWSLAPAPEEFEPGFTLTGWQGAWHDHLFGPVRPQRFTCTEHWESYLQARIETVLGRLNEAEEAERQEGREKPPEA